MKRTLKHKLKRFMQGLYISLTFSHKLREKNRYIRLYVIRVNKKENGYTTSNS